MSNVYILPSLLKDSYPSAKLDLLLIFEICVIVSFVFLFFGNVLQELYYYYTGQVSLTKADAQVIEDQKTFLSEFMRAKDKFVFFCDQSNRLMIGHRPGKTSSLFAGSIPALTLAGQQIYNCSANIDQLNEYVSRPS
jgi:hypothetical protein